MARVTEKWSLRQFSRGRSARRVFEVDGGPTTDDAAQTAASTYASTTYGSAHPLDPSLVVPPGGIGVEPVVPGLYRVTVDYEANTFSGGDPTNLFSRKWQVLPAEVIWQEVPADLLPPSPPTGFPETPLVLQQAMTSNRVPIGDGITRRVAWYRFRMRRYESGSDVLTKNLNYQNRWNFDAVTLPRYGTAQPGELKIDSISAIEHQEQGSTTAVLVEYTIEARPRRTVAFNGGAPVTIHGWHRRILDEGIVAFDGSDWIPLYTVHDPLAGPISDPVLMNGRGWPLKWSQYTAMKRAGSGYASVSEPEPPLPPPAGAVMESCPDGVGIVLSTCTGVFLNYDMTEGPATFAGLNFGANN